MKTLFIAMMGIFALSLGFVAAADKDAKTTAYIAQMTGVT